MRYLAEQVARALIVLAGVLTVRAADLPRAAGRHQTLPAASSSSRKITQSALRSVRVEPANQEGATRVVIEGNGPLPEPASGAPVKPPRIFLDFTDVLPPGAVDPVSPNPLVSRIRIAPHSASPLVTRVVLDLIKETPYRVDSSARAQGRVIVILGAAQSQASKPVSPPLAPPRGPVSSPPSGRAAASTSAPPAQARAVSAEAQYGVRIAPMLLRLYALRPLLEAIDRRADAVPGDLLAAAKEFDELSKLLTAIRSPATRASTHALLLRTCTLGARAARLRETTATSQDAASSWDAASAAAGALLMLDRANTDLTVK
jgi:hypothetical protein